MLIGELLLKDDISSSDNSIEYYNPYTKDIRQVVSNEISNVVRERGSDRFVVMAMCSWRSRGDPG